MKTSLSSSSFRRTLFSKDVLIVNNVRFQYCFSSNASRVGFVVKKKLGNAVARNLFKRRCRFLFRGMLVENSLSGFLLVVRPLIALCSFKDLATSFTAFNKSLSKK